MPIPGKVRKIILCQLVIPVVMEPDGVTINKYIADFVKLEVDNYLHKNPLMTEAMLQKIQASEKERKAIAGVTKLARERAKKANWTP